jgi:uroporphyrinogen III methyltransferase/synthase
MFAAGHDARHLGNCRLAAIGAVTASALRPYGLNADAVPDAFRAEDLADCLRASIAGQAVLLIRASRGREILAETLAPLAKRLQQVVAYESVNVEVADDDVLEMIATGRVDWITVTSSAIATSLVRMIGPHLQKTKLVSISPVTTARLKELGFPPAAEATEYTAQGVVDALVAASGRASSMPGV